MIAFEWPWALALLPLPWLLRRLLPRTQVRQQAVLRVPVLTQFVQGEGAAAAPTRGISAWLALLGWVALLAATARPLWQGPPAELPLSGRDLMLAVDISGSMQARDFVIEGRRVDRLTATKAVAARFIERRQGDRLGLILFGRQAYLQVPLTFDTVTVATLLEEAQVGFAGQETAIGDAIGLALKRAREKPQLRSVLILLTDGANTAGVIEPKKAAQLAAADGLRVYTIGIGSAGSGSILDLFAGGSELDEATLRMIADTTGGRYFRARDAAELARIYAMLDELEPTEAAVAGFRPRRALFMWPLTLALACGVALVCAPSAARLRWRRA